MVTHEYVKNSVVCEKRWASRLDANQTMDSYAVKPPTYEPVVAVCPRCGNKLAVKASTRAWPKCPDCEETMERFTGEDDSIN